MNSSATSDDYIANNRTVIIVKNRATLKKAMII